MVKCESLRINMFRITHTGKSVNFLVTIRHFRYFRVNTLLSICKKLDITYNVSSNPPTAKKLLHAYHAYVCFSVWFNRKIIEWFS